jgi:hypothetical protein
MKFLGNKSFLILILIFMLYSNNFIFVSGFRKETKSNEKELDQDMQFDSTGRELKADFTFIELDNPLAEKDKGFILQKEMILIEPYVLKMIYTPLQQFHILKMSEIVIFNDFEIIFDMNILSKPVFSVGDRERQVKLMRIIDSLKLRYGQNSENCKFIFTNDIQNMSNINLMTTSIADFSNLPNTNQYMALIINIFCFSSMDKMITFHSEFAKMYNNFINSTTSNNLFYFNKLKMNNLKILFKTSRVQSEQMLPGGSSIITDENSMESELNNGLNPMEPVNINSSMSKENISYAFILFGKDGVLFSDAPGNSMKNVLYSFNYDNIKDCLISMAPKRRVLPRQILSRSANKCCIQMNIDFKDVYDNILNVCSFRTSEYQCNIEAKFIQENLSNKCSWKLSQNIKFAFDNDTNIRDFIASK